MTFKEMALQEEIGTPSILKRETAEESLWKSLFDNHSPIIKVWFVLMLLNFIFILWLI